MFLTFFIITLLANGIESVEKYVCESKNLNIECPANSYIIINNASYGRHSPTICPKISIIQNLNCSSNATQTLREKCNGKNNCSVPVINQIFGDPCAGTYKYLEFNYTCFTESTIGSIPPIISPPHTPCPTNEVFSYCNAVCQRTCFHRKPCCKNSPCVSGCVCAENFVRDPVTSRCVYPFQCRNRRIID